MTTASPSTKTPAAGPRPAFPLVEPYLFFGGRCEEAIAFYTKAIGAKAEHVMKHKDSPQPPPPGMLAPGFENKVMHASFKVGGATVMASDGCHEGARFEGFSLSLSFGGVEEAERAFRALAEGGTVKMPLAQTFWSPRFGMLTDKFGVGWMVNVCS